MRQVSPADFDKMSFSQKIRFINFCAYNETINSVSKDTLRAVLIFVLKNNISIN